MLMKMDGEDRKALIYKHQGKSGHVPNLYLLYLFILFQ